jgi:hypothetical protein
MIMERERKKRREQAKLPIDWKKMMGAVEHAVMHGAVEGIPGYVNYLRGAMLNKPTFLERYRGASRDPSPFTSASRLATITSLVGLVPMLTGRQIAGGAAMGSVLGFAGGAELGSRLSEKLTKNMPIGSPEWSASRFTLGAALPLASTVVGGVAGGKLMSILSRLRLERKKKESGEHLYYRVRALSDMFREKGKPFVLKRVLKTKGVFDAKSLADLFGEDKQRGGYLLREMEDRISEYENQAVAENRERRMA